MFYPPSKLKDHCWSTSRVITLFHAILFLYKWHSYKNKRQQQQYKKPGFLLMTKVYILPILFKRTKILQSNLLYICTCFFFKLKKKTTKIKIQKNQTKTLLGYLIANYFVHCYPLLVFINDMVNNTVKKILADNSSLCISKPYSNGKNDPICCSENICVGR